MGCSKLVARLRRVVCLVKGIGSRAVQRATAQARLNGHPHLVQLAPEVLLALLFHAEVSSQAGDFTAILCARRALIALEPAPLIVLCEPNRRQLDVKRLRALEVVLSAGGELINPLSEDGNARGLRSGAARARARHPGRPGRRGALKLLQGRVAAAESGLDHGELRTHHLVDLSHAGLLGRGQSIDASIRFASVGQYIGREGVELLHEPSAAFEARLGSSQSALHG